MTEDNSTPVSANQYDDPSFNYQSYWDGRSYEHRAEEIAFRRWLDGKHFRKAVDVGGGFGRLGPILADYADEVIIAEPSKQQLEIGAKFLEGHPTVKRELRQADNLGYDDNSVDLVSMVRVMHHLPNPSPAFAEIHRVLVPGGTFILEVANLANGLNRVRYALKGKGIPTTPVDIRSEENKGGDEMIAFCNHNPTTVRRQLAEQGLRVVDQQSVSNLRSARLKSSISQDRLLKIEKALQKPLGAIAFGPSHFFLIQKD